MRFCYADQISDRVPPFFELRPDRRSGVILRELIVEENDQALVGSSAKSHARRPFDLVIEGADKTTIIGQTRETVRCGLLSQVVLYPLGAW